MKENPSTPMREPVSLSWFGKQNATKSTWFQNMRCARPKTKPQPLARGKLQKLTQDQGSSTLCFGWIPLWS
jgi:hypothetical protein